MDTPISLFMGMVGAGNGILLESAEVDGRWGRYSILACDMALFISCREGRLALRVEDQRFAPLGDLEGQPFVEGLRALMRRLEITPPENIAGLPPITRALYGYLGFGMAGLFNDKLASVMPPEEADCLLALPGTVLVFDHLYNRLCQISLGEHRPLRSAHEAVESAANGNSGTGLDPDAISAEPGEAGYKAYVERMGRCCATAKPFRSCRRCGFPRLSRAIPLSFTGACAASLPLPTCFTCASRI